VGEYGHAMQPSPLCQTSPPDVRVRNSFVRPFYQPREHNTPFRVLSSCAGVLKTLRVSPDREARPSRGAPLRVPATPTAQAGICGHRCPRLSLALHRRPPVPPRRGSAMPVGQDRIWKDEVVQSSLNRLTPMSILLRELRGIQASATFGVLRSLVHSDLRRTEDAPC
jgi:hypothetical protein